MGVVLSDVGPRDGLQNEAVALEPAVRAELARRLAAARLQRVEAVSFVRDDRVPQMAGAEDVVAALDLGGATRYAGLVLNERGYDRLAASGLREVHVAFAVTESFQQRNAGSSVEDGLAATNAIAARARADGIEATVTLSVAFGCPFEGRVDEGRVAELAGRVEADEVVLADTIGVATPGQVRRLVSRVAVDGRRVGGHFHNTRNTGYANAVAALEAGVEVLDASVGGLGGCPFAPKATGNIATEDLVYLLEGDGIETGVDLDALIAAAEWMGTVLGRPLEGLLHRAGRFPAG
jgi:hydroxymethylglutaryl-CoA lyase/(R)-citramalyl-CoA lyase